MKKKLSTTKKISTENKKTNYNVILVIIIFIVLIFIVTKLIIKNDKINNIKTNEKLSVVTNEKVYQTEGVVKDKESVLKLMNILSVEEASDKVFENAFNIIKKENLDINAVDRDGKTVLMYAAFYNNREIIDSIIKKEVNINAVDRYGRTALHWAAYYGKEEAISILLKNGADKNIKDELGNTALDISEFEGYENISGILR